MAILNNLLINQNRKYPPFLFNLISFRRRFISSGELMLIESMISKGIYTSQSSTEQLTQEELGLYNQLISEKQFITEPLRLQAEQLLLENHRKSNESIIDKNMFFSIQVTQDCNMNCGYCFEKSYLNKKDSLCMTKEHIDAIHEFYYAAAYEAGERFTAPFIRITGGETLLNMQTVDIVNYIAERFPDSRFYFFSNGVNLLKYYNLLPLDRIENFSISLDGVMDIHMKRRYNTDKYNKEIYADIIAGIKRLLADNVKVDMKTAADRNNYKEIPGFLKYLEDEGIYKHPYFNQVINVLNDMSHPLDINEDFNDRNDIQYMEMYFSDTLKMYNMHFYPSLSYLISAVLRKNNQKAVLRLNRCDTRFCSNYFFSPNGNVYFCDCADVGKGIVGTYYPEISFNGDRIFEMAEINILTDESCKSCVYKFVCLGGCPLNAVMKNKKMYCGAYGEQELIDNLSIFYAGR